MNRFRDWYRSKPTRPMILAHRGDSFRAPENTLEAAIRGFEAGADGWELDVQRTLDDALVVIHDPSLSRTTDVGARFAGDPRAADGFRVADFTLAEIRTLDAGSWFADPTGGPRTARGFGTLDRLDPDDLIYYRSGAVRIPTLAEALDLTIEADSIVNVEIKPTSAEVDSLVELALRAIRTAGATDLVAVSSFDHEVVAMVAAREPGVATGALVDGPLDLPAIELLRSLGADALHASVHGLDLSDLRVPILAYTINEAGPSGLASRLAEGGVAGLFTDDPASLSLLFSVIPSSMHTKFHSGTTGHLAAFRSGVPTPRPSRPGSSPEIH